MRRAWPSILAVAVAAVLQVGLAPHLVIGGATPNFLLIVVVALALTMGPVTGCSAGFAAGLILDLIGTGPVGLWALVFCVVGFIAGMLTENMFASGWLLPVTVAFVASLVSEIAYGLLLAVVGAAGDLGGALLSVVLPSAVYNTVLAVLVYPWLARFLRQEPSVEMVQRMS